MEKEQIQQVIDDFDIPRRLLSDIEVAKILQCAPQSLRNNRHNRRGLPYTRQGRSIRYLPTDVAKYILKHRIDPQEG